MSTSAVPRHAAYGPLRATLEAAGTPIGPLDTRIAAHVLALGCRVVEGPGSSVTFDWQGRKASFQRPHPGKGALRYRIKAVREFLAVMGVTT